MSIESVDASDQFSIGSVSVDPGVRVETELQVAMTAVGSALSLPVIVVHGAKPGPCIWLNAAIHGDELNGVEIIRRVLTALDARALQGTVLAVPVVNVPGFVNGDRYLPDRRDLNRSFPGSGRGSLASRIAKVFMDEIVSRCTVGVDLHTGSDNRTNLPQIRCDMDDAPTRHLAKVFGAPIAMHASTRDGSLRQAGSEAGATVLLYEGGQALRFDEESIRVGTSGVLRVLEDLSMIDVDNQSDRFIDDTTSTIVCKGSRWVRARRAGIAQTWPQLGSEVKRGETVGRIHDAYGRQLSEVKASVDGIIVGVNLDPIVNQGDALIHIAQPSLSD